MPDSPNGEKIIQADATIKVEESEMNEDGSFNHSDSPADDANKGSSPEKSLHEIISEQLKSSREKIIDSADSGEETQESGDGEEPDSSTDGPEEDGSDQSEGKGEDTEKEPDESLKDQPEETQDTQDEEDITKVPPNLKAETKVRFEKLVESNQSLKAQVDTLDEYKQNAQEVFAATGANDEQMAETFELLRLSNSANREDNLDAIKALGKIQKSLARRIGERIPGDDLLSDHVDLKEKVDNIEMTLEDAEREALTRNKLKVFEDEQQNIVASAEKQAGMDAETATAQTEIINLATHWHNNDPNWKAVGNDVLEYAQSIKGKYPVKIIPQLLEDFYVQTTARLKRAKNERKAVKEDMPLSNSSRSPGNREVKSHKDAISNALSKSLVA